MLKRTLFKNGFVDFYRNRDFFDVTLVTPQREYQCHRFILSFSSDFFDTLLKSNFKEKHTSTIQLQEDDTRNVLPDIIEFMYTGKIELTLKNVVPILNMSDIYLMKGLKRMCQAYIHKNLNRSNALPLLADAIEFSQESISELCLKKVASNFIHMYDSDYSLLDKATFSKLLHHPQLVCITTNFDYLFLTQLIVGSS